MCLILNNQNLPTETTSTKKDYVYDEIGNFIFNCNAIKLNS